MVNRLSVITNEDVTVPKVDLVSNTTDIHDEIYNRSRRLATAIYVLHSQSDFVVSFNCRRDAKWLRGERRALVGPSFFAARA